METISAKPVIVAIEYLTTNRQSLNLKTFNGSPLNLDVLSRFNMDLNSLFELAQLLSGEVIFNYVSQDLDVLEVRAIQKQLHVSIW